MRAAALLVLLLASGVRAETLDDVTLVERFLALDAGEARARLLAARRVVAETALATAPSWRVQARHETAGGAAGDTDTGVVGVGVSFGLASLNPVERRRAAAEGESLSHALRADLANVVSDLRLASLDAWRATRQRSVVEAHRDELDALVTELEALVEGGEQSRFDLLRLEDQASTQDTRLAAAAVAADAALARVSALAGMAVSAVELDPGPAPALDDGLREELVQEHPRLRALRLLSEASASSLLLARRSHGAEMDFGAGYRVDDEAGLEAEDGYEVELGVSLPRRGLRKAAMARARADQAEAELSLARAEREVRADIEAAARGLLAAGAAAPGPGTARELREGGMARYREGEADLTELLGILEALQERALLDVETEATRRRARLELDRATALRTAPHVASLVEESFR